MNVAITRARRHVCLVGDSDTCSATPFLARMLRYFEEHGDVRSAAQYGASAAAGGRHAANAKPSAARGRVPSKDLPNKELLSEAQAEERLRARIQSFLADESQRAHALPPSLNSFERMVAHQMAAQLGLEHVSTGEGRQRFITLIKKGASSPSAHHSAPSPSDAPLGASAVVSAVVSSHEGPPAEQHPADAETPTSIDSDRASAAERCGEQLEEKPSEAMPTTAPTPAAYAPHSPPSRCPMDTRQQQLALRVRQLFTQLSAAGLPPNEAAVQAMAAAQTEVAQGDAADLPNKQVAQGEAADLPKKEVAQGEAADVQAPDQSKVAAAAPTKDLPNKELLMAGRQTKEPTKAAQAADARAAAARAAAARAADVQTETSSAAAAAAAAAAATAREAALAESNHALREAAVAREARQREVEAERQVAEEAVRLAMRKEEDQRRKELARAKKERRKHTTADDSGGGGGGAVGDDDDVDAALAALGLAPNGASAAEPMANPTAPSALPWGRDREAERERERLQAALRQKLASGDGSHQKRQQKKK